MIGPQLRGVGGVGRQYDVFPLDGFDLEKQYAIARQVARPRPPAQWIRLGLAEIESRAWLEWHWQRGIACGPQKRPPFPRSLRAAVYARDGHRCLHCGSRDRLSLDHIHPFSKGGADTFENLQTLCRPCNSRKGARVLCRT